MAQRLNQTFIVHFLNRNRCNRDALSEFQSHVPFAMNLHQQLLVLKIYYTRSRHRCSYNFIRIHTEACYFIQPVQHANCSYEQHVNLSFYESYSFSLNKRSFVCFACLSYSRYSEITFLFQLEIKLFRWISSLLKLVLR